MKKLPAVSFYLGSFLAVSLSHAADFKQSKFTQVVNDVWVVSAADSSQKFAAVNDLFTMPDLVRTGAASRAELVAEDKTITRVGANTVFSFDPANRTIDLQQGSLLFHSPKGKGGGTIRTGSATASVLGTTIIVTTTHNGGFKVIDLEGHVAIKFLNGLRQSLNPGQMTFILPGGRAAPIITIRLDALTKNSHLVQGFDQPLPSLPLIVQQVETQNKQIESGQAEDTGLLVGDGGDATPTTVPVVSVDTIASNQKSSTSAGAVTINSPTLDPTFITSASSSGSTIAGFVAPATAPNIIINTPTIDLSPYANQASEFEFVAPSIPNISDSGTITINGSATFSGLPANAFSFLGLTADNQLLIASGATVEADVGIFALASFNGMTLNGVNILDNAPTGVILIESPSSLTFNGGSLQAQGAIGIFSNGTVTLNNATVNTGSLDIFATGSVSVTDDINHSFQVTNVLVGAGGDLLADGGDSNPVTGVTQPGSILLAAAGTLQAQNLKLDSATVSLAANTVNLLNVAFSNGSVVSLASANGVLAPNPNTGAASVSGDVNFIHNVTYGGAPAQNAVGNGITISAVPAGFSSGLGSGGVFINTPLPNGQLPFPNLPAGSVVPGSLTGRSVP